MAWKKGQSGNPGGRPKEYADFRATCQSYTKEAIAALVEELRNPDNAVPAAKVLLEHGWGKPAQAVHVSGVDGGPLAIVSIGLKK